MTSNEISIIRAHARMIRHDSGSTWTGSDVASERRVRRRLRRKLCQSSRFSSLATFLSVNERRGNAGLGSSLPPPSMAVWRNTPPRNCVSRGRRPEISSALPTYTRENDGTRTTVEKEHERAARGTRRRKRRRRRSRQKERARERERSG